MTNAEENKSEPEAEVKSAFHRAANYSFIAIVISFFLNFVLRSSFSGVPAAGRVLSLVIGVILLSAIPAGIFSLFGIHKHGRKGLLVKGLFGAIIPGILIAMAVPAFMNVKEASQAHYVDQVIAEISKHTPMMLDEVTRFDRVYRESKSIVVADFTIMDLAVNEIDLDLWEEQMVPLIKDDSKDSAVVSLTKAGVQVVYRYKDKDGEWISDITFAEE